MLVIHVCLSFVLVEDVRFFYIICIRLNTENFYSSYDYYRLQIEWSVYPRLKNFISAFEWGFIFKRCFPICHEFISNFVIMVDYSRFFMD